MRKIYVFFYFLFIVALQKTYLKRENKISSLLKNYYVEKTKIYFTIFLFSLFNYFVKAQDYIPIEIKSGFNADVIANGVGGALTSTTHDVDGVSYNLVSSDFQLTSSSTPFNYGLPVNRIIHSQISSTPGLAYKMAPYDGFNDLRLSSIEKSSTLEFQSGIKVTDLFLLVTSGSGVSTIDIEVNFSDGSSQVFENRYISDWYGGSYFAITGIGRINRDNNNLEVSSINPRLYQLQLSLLENNYNKLAKSITITKKGGSGIPNVFAVSANQYDTCGSIKNLSTNIKDFSSVEVTWDTLQNLPGGGYDYYITHGNEIPTSETIPTGNVKKNKALINSLTIGETYNFWVRSNCGVNERGFWRKITFITGELSVTYDKGDIATSYASSTVTTSTPTECPGSLSLEIPNGFRIKSTNVSYQMQAQARAYMSEQKSLLVCKTNNLTEEEISSGSGSTGTYNYNRNTSIANGLTGKVEFELRAWRTWGGENLGCDSSYNKVTNGTWKIAVTLEPITITPDSKNILYVKKGGSGKQDGSSWDNAIGELADALKWANDENKKNAWSNSNPLKIYVSKGTYHPLYSPEDGENYGTDKGKDNTFLMVNNVKLYGGFDPDNNIKTLDDKRIIPDGKNEAPNGTILSGDFNGDDIISGSGKTLEIKNNTENAYHVVTGINENSIYLFLDGFTIKGGNANQNSEIRVNAQTVHRDRGAGIYFRSSDSSAILNLKNVDVTYNQTTANGGGVYNESSNNSFSEINIKQSRISNNIGRFGAGIHSYSFKSKSEVKIFNSIIYNNSSVENGGGIYSYSYSSFSVSLVNSSLSGNTSTNGSGVYSLSSSSSVNLINSNLLENKGNSIVYFDRGNNNQLKIHNSIIYGNKKLDDILFTNSRELYGGYVPTEANLEYKNSYIQGITSTENGNIDGTLDPLFTSESSGDYSLQQNSPLVNKGDNALYTGDINTDTDLANNPRLFDGTIDVGAYESQSYQAPKIINVTSITDNGLYGIGKDITITVEFNKTVNVDTTNGIPKLLLETGLVDRSAEYISGTGTNTLTFIYNIQQGDLNENLEYNSTSSLSLNGSTIKSSSLIDAVLLLPEPKEKGSLSANKNIVIDGVRPVVVSIKRLNDSPTNAANVSFEVTFSEPVSGVDISDFTLTTIGSASGNIASVIAVDDKYTVVVNSISGQGEIRLDLKPSGTGIMDAAENLITNGFNSGETYEIDLVAPAMPTDFVGVGDDEEVNLSWNANTEDDFKQYNLFVLIEGTKTLLATIPSGTETYKHTGLNNNTSYTYYISAEDNLGNKSSEATTSATTLANQIITFNPLQNIIYGDEIELSATSSSGLEVELQSSNNSIAEVYKDSSGKWKLKAKAIGNITITALQLGDNTYLPATNVSQFLTINPAAITVTAEPKSKNYGEIDPGLTYIISGLVNNDIQSDILSGSLQREIGEDVGTYEIQKGTLSATSNYYLVFVNNYLEITKATISGINFSDNSFVYDGSPKSLSIVGSLPSGATVSYTNNNQTNAGRYLVTASIDGGVNYEDFTLTANLEITKATISGINFSDNS
ncbi:MBG domain-containing protein, partial [Chishuiella sp.]|uniref:MBG domain-containing protein n=1 Tax=Chishuiella sp. TaxID=1969467 RepID=UPI0028A68407